MENRWLAYLIPPFLITLILVTGSQYVFIQNSFYEDLGLGRTGNEFTLVNYFNFFTDPFYMRTFWVTIKVSALATIFTLFLGFPIAYVIARMKSRIAMLLLAGIVVSTFVTIVIKVFGLIIIFSANGILNTTLLQLGLIDRAYSIIGTQEGVVVGLMHFTIGFSVLLLYSVVVTVPPSLEYAAQIHGASRWRVYQRVIIPLCIPGFVVGGLMIFNMCMGAFTSAALLGGGRVLTLPVLIQRTVMMEVRYSTAASIAFVLLISVILINLISLMAIRRFRSARLVIA
jgi:putative spermidine/putrescine transport system permease protein|tara:strand:- start:642 stop:1496 length:855 start_codon:yes stop_codon:yes gene_type:complete